MLNSPPEVSRTSKSHLGHASHGSMMDPWDLDRFVGIALRQKWYMAGWTAALFALAMIYALLATPKFTATAEILVDTPRVAAVADSYDTSTPPAAALEDSVVDSQIEIVRSERVALAVISKLKLADQPSFQPNYIPVVTSVLNAARETLKGLKALFNPSSVEPIDSAFEQERAVVQALEDHLDVKRVARSLVLQVSFTWEDPELAKNIVNAFTSEYLRDQFNAKFEATQQAAVWLQDRIAELRERSIAADHAVQAFRAEHGLFAVDGMLVDEQQLASANSQLSEARSKVAETQARFDRIQSIIRSGSADAAVGEALVNPVVAALRTKYVEASKREQDISTKLGPNHIQAANLRADMKQYENIIFEELNRIGESYRSDLQIAQDRYVTAEKNLRTLLSQTAINNQTLVQLRELERTSDTYKTLYQSYLQRYQQAAQQQSFPVINARVITAASRPLLPSKPKKPLVIVLGLLAGMVVGAGVGAFRELRDRSFRTGEQISTKLGLEFLGTVAKLPGDATSRMRYVLDFPLSSTSETFRALKVAADLALRGKRTKVIGITSTMPGEGKTSIAKNFATLIAHLGARVILLDGDMRNSGLSRALCPDVKNGLAQVLTGKVTPAQAELLEEDSGLIFIPATADHSVANTNELLASKTMRDLLEQLENRFDYIIVDLPPIGPVIDVRASADIFDAFVIAVEWGTTPQALVKSTLAGEPAVVSKCIGVVLNKVDPQGMRLYQSNEFRNYSLDQYSAYHEGRSK